MRRRLALSTLAASLTALAVVAVAGAVPPMISALSQQDRHPTATISAPKADFATIYLATKPDRATDGYFLSENVSRLDLLTDSEIQLGRWLFEDRVDPGTYYVMMWASPDFDACYIWDSGGYDPSCAQGFSNVLTLVVPKPQTRYAAAVTTYRYIAQATLRLTAKPLGEPQPYRVCYRTAARKNRCLRGRVNGYDWDSSASHSLTVSTRGLATLTTFTWYVGSKAVASKRVRVR
jgi:hypothetical protein